MVCVLSCISGPIIALNPDTTPPNQKGALNQHCPAISAREARSEELSGSDNNTVRYYNGGAGASLCGVIIRVPYCDRRRLGKALIIWGKASSCCLPLACLDITPQLLAFALLTASRTTILPAHHQLQSRV